MTRINLFHNTKFHSAPSTLNSVAWGKSNLAKANFTKNNFDKTSTLIFAALLIACSLTVGCSSDKPKPVSSINPSPIAPPTPPITTSPATVPPPVEQAAVKHVHKKVVRKVPPTVTYVDNVSGVTFQYPRKYALKTGDAATTTTTKPSPTHIDRDEVFHRLETILATVKINPIVAPEVNAEAKTNTQPASNDTPAR